jgi:hypothetical protein
MLTHTEEQQQQDPFFLSFLKLKCEAFAQHNTVQAATQTESRDRSRYLIEIKWREEKNIRESIAVAATSPPSCLDVAIIHQRSNSSIPWPCILEGRSLYTSSSLRRCICWCGTHWNRVQAHRGVECNERSAESGQL